ncbi:MAG TPA: COX15/CtaA family protein [Gemmatimonadales bacterium]|nr:COX15/CtaA family protein [Gemmatimonadales bacterium]
MPTPSSRAIGRWLLLWCAMLVALVVIGGVTRLTESGLSITQWKPITGVVPPLTHADWVAEFGRYQQIPEYQELKRGMTLPEFQRIYFWEFLHRLWARLLGLAFAVPFAWFVLRGQVRRALAWRLGALLVLLGLQGALGWYMVSSGLVDRTDVSQYRLAAHLALALVLYAYALWTALGLLATEGGTRTPRLRRWAGVYVALVFLTIVAGAFVAGLNAGGAWNTWPLMEGSFVPAGYGQFVPFWRNVFENPAAVQFHHRWLGFSAMLGAWGLAAAGWYARGASATLRRRALALAAMGLVQAGLGIATLLLAVPIPLAAVHQLGAVLLLTVALRFRHACRPAGLTGAGEAHSFPEVTP